jgi:hypothetical protein
MRNTLKYLGDRASPSALLSGILDMQVFRYAKTKKFSIYILVSSHTVLIRPHDLVAIVRTDSTRRTWALAEA